MKAETVKKIILKNKIVIIAAAVGAVLLIISGMGDGREIQPVQVDDFSVKAEEEKLAEALSQISGAGEVTVVLSAEGGSRKSVASNIRRDGEDEESETVIIRSGTSQESPVTVEVVYPKYRGAIVVAQGADNAGVRLAIINCVSSVTGLTADRISVVKMK